MNTRFTFSSPNPLTPVILAGRAAFSLVEIIITVGLLSVIMLGLLMMFDQTQRAFRTSMTQSDVLGAGRAAAAMISSGLEEMTPSDSGPAVYNFYMTNYGSVSLPPVLMPLSGIGSPARTNVMEAVYFLSRENQQWIGTGYIIGTPQSGFGTLYRFNTNCPVSQGPQTMYTNFQSAVFQAYTGGTLPVSVSRVADGVVHFKVRVFGTNGMMLTNSFGNSISGPSGITNILVQAADNDPTQGGEAHSYLFTDQAVPVSVEFEIGVLEDRVLSRLKNVPDPTFQRRQLTNSVAVGAIHLFRQRVPIHNFDLTAYQ